MFSCFIFFSLNFCFSLFASLHAFRPFAEAAELGRALQASLFGALGLRGFLCFVFDPKAQAEETDLFKRNQTVRTLVMLIQKPWEAQAIDYRSSSFDGIFPLPGISLRFAGFAHLWLPLISGGITILAATQWNPRIHCSEAGAKLQRTKSRTGETTFERHVNHLAEKTSL